MQNIGKSRNGCKRRSQFVRNSRQELASSVGNSLKFFVFLIKLHTLLTLFSELGRLLVELSVLNGRGDVYGYLSK